MAQKKALGRGLEALLKSNNEKIEESIKKDPSILGTIAEIDINKIDVNPFQPRLEFDETALNELFESIKNHGIIQPITVRKTEKEKFQIISGERRLRASKKAGIKKIPSYIRIANDQSMVEMALVENIQRENLDAIEIAISYKRLIEEIELTQEELAKKVSKKRSTITNYLRLLKLPAEIQKAIKEKTISMGHARALINIEDRYIQKQIFKRILKNGLSVRKVEELCQQNKSVKSKNIIKLSFEQERNLERLGLSLKTKLEIKKNEKNKGKIMINFNNNNELTHILNTLNS